MLLVPNWPQVLHGSSEVSCLKASNGPAFGALLAGSSAVWGLYWIGFEAFYGRDGLEL